MNGSDADRRQRLKLIPSVEQGGWVIKHSVGHTPILLANKLKSHYFRYTLVCKDAGCERSMRGPLC